MNRVEEKFKMDMGATLRRIRKLKAVSQDELAAAANLTRTSIVNIEKGRQSVSLGTLYNVCLFLKISPADLFPDSKNSITLMVQSEIAELKDERDEWKQKYNNLKNLLSKLKKHITD